MTTRLYEIHDRATCIPVMATRLYGRNQKEIWLLRRAGYSKEQISSVHSQVEPYVILCMLDGIEAQCDPYNWSSFRIRAAHLFIISNWDTLTSGAVIDIEFILKETSEPKFSEL